MNSSEEKRKLNFFLGNRVRALRENLKLSRRDFSERIEISEYFLTEIELGRRGVSLSTLCRAADVLCTTTDYLLTGRSQFTDATSITAMLSTIDQPFLKGAEDILKIYLSNISLIQSQMNDSNDDSQ